MSSIAGLLVTETFGYDGGRQVTVYVSPGPPEAVVFAGDGQLTSQWGGGLEAADVPPTMIVGVHRTANEMFRLHEYSPGFDPGRFAAPRSSSQAMSAGGCGRASASRCPQSAPRCSASRPVANSRSPSGCGTRTSTARSSAPHPARVTGRPQRCRDRCRARTSSPAKSMRPPGDDL